MKKVWLTGVLVLVLLVTVASYNVGRTASTASSLGPAEVVRAYYDWYLDYVKGEGDGTPRNPLVSGAYRSSPHLAPELVAEVEALVAGFDRGGFDPFLLAQDIPSEVKVGEAQVVGDTAIVPVTTSFAGHSFTVRLAKRGEDRWLITGITPAQ